MMKTITTAIDLKEAIHRLENQQALQKQLLKEQLQIAREKLRPVNLIRDSFRETFRSPKLMKWILFAAAGMTTIFLKRKKKSRSDPSLFKKLFGAFLQTGIKAVFSELF